MSDWLWRNVIYGVFGAALLAVAVAWVRGALERLVPPPDVLWRRLRRLARRAVPEAGPADTRFALLFAPLDGDGPKAEHTGRLLAAFAGVQGFRRLRAETPIRIESEDLDRAEREAEERARALGRSAGADLVVWGAVLQGGKELQLWFTPAHGAGTGEPQVIAGGAAAPEAAEKIAAQLAALALAQLPEEEARQRFLDASLEHVLARVEALLARPPGALGARDRAGLERARADALARLGADLGDPARLRTALAAFEALHDAAEPAERPALARRIGEAAAALAVLVADRALLDAAEAHLDAAARGLGPRGGAILAEVHDLLGRTRYWRAAWDADPAALDAAAEAFRDAAEAFDAAGLADRAADARISGALIEAMRLARRGDPAGMEAAAAALRSALGTASPERQPRRRAQAGMMLAWIEAMLAQEQGDADALEAAARRAETVQAGIPRSRAPLAWAQARAMQASAEAARASFFGDAEALAAARRGIEEAIAAVPGGGAIAFAAALRVERARTSLALAELEGDRDAAEAARREAEEAAAGVAASARADRLDAALLVARGAALAGQLRGDEAAVAAAAAEARALAAEAGTLGLAPLRTGALLVAHAAAASAAAMRSDRAAMAAIATELAALAQTIPRASRPVEHARVLAARGGILGERARLSASPAEAATAWAEAAEALHAVLDATPADRLPLARAWFRMLEAEAAMRLAPPGAQADAAARLIEAARAVEVLRQHAQASAAMLLRAEAMLIRADHAQDAAAAAAARETFRAALDRIPRRQAPQRVRAAIGAVEASLRTLGPGAAARPTGEAARALDALIAGTPGLPAPLAALGRLAAGTGLVASGRLAGDAGALARGLALLRAAEAETTMPPAFRAEAAARLAGAMGAAREAVPALVGPGEIAAALRRAAELAEAAGLPDKAQELRQAADAAPA